MKAAYFTAAIPEPFRILGLQLKPLSLGRYRLMRRFDCAFVGEKEASATMGDLVIGLLICSMRCDEFLKFVEAKDFQKQIRKWGKRVSSSPIIGRIPWLGRRWRKTRSFNVIEKIALFKRYIEEGSTMPEYIEEHSNNGGGGAHWCQSVEVVLRSEVGWSEEEINESPLTKAFSDYFTWAEGKGAVRLMSEGDQHAGEENSKIFAALAPSGAPSGVAQGEVH
jgi:hypothetical protein